MSNNPAASVLPAASATVDAQSDARWRVALRNLFPFAVVGALWEVTAHVGVFPRRLFPPLEDVVAAWCA